jgi:hypothetical protein
MSFAPRETSKVPPLKRKLPAEKEAGELRLPFLLQA